METSASFEAHYAPLLYPTQSSASGAIRQTTCAWNADQPVGAAVCSPFLNERRYIGDSISTQFLAFLVPK
jgi:hypothetical protein